MDTILKVSYKISDEALYEVQESNKRHFNKSNALQGTGRDILGTIPGVSDISARSENLMQDVDGEKERYLRFAKEFDTFVSYVRGSDHQLAESMRSSVQVLLLMGRAGMMRWRMLLRLALGLRGVQ